jgi:hypothetical protein
MCPNEHAVVEYHRLSMDEVIQSLSPAPVKNLVCARPPTTQERCRWRGGSRGGVEPVEDELRSISCIIHGRIA